MSNYKMGETQRSNRPIILAIVAGAALIAIGLAVGLGVGLRSNDNDNSNQGTATASNAGSGKQTYKSSVGTYRHAAVAADNVIASRIGTEILARHRGNAVDAAVASLFAIGLLNAHSCGIGGGSFIVIYDKESNTWHAIDSRETAPLAATQNMYKDTGVSSQTGGQAVGLPGEVLGLYRVHERFGKLSWADVVQPAIDLCRDGVPLSHAMYLALTARNLPEDFKADFAPYFDENGNVQPEGTLIKLPKLQTTLQRISDDPFSFYNGSLAQDIVADLQEKGGIITREDLSNYSVKWSEPSMMSLPGGLKLYSINAPGAGPVLSYILNILAGYDMKPSDVEDKERRAVTYHRIIEAFKFAYGKRMDLGDEEFVDVADLVKNMTDLSYGEATRALIDDSRTHSASYYHPVAMATEDHGTSHLSVVDGVGSVVAATATINLYFGSKVRGSRTGIIFNDEMDDFSTPNTTNFFGLPASPTNFIEPGKRPMSSMCPAIVWDENLQKVRLVTGGAGGSKIPSALALNIIDVLWLNRTVGMSVDSPRLHHQLIPDKIQVEAGFDEDVVKGFKTRGHETANFTGWSVVQAIHLLDDGQLQAVSDYRKGGAPDGY